MSGEDEAFLLQVQKERDDLLHQMEVLERQIEELCARDDFEKAELLDVELQTLRHRLELVLAMVPQNDDDEEEDDQDELAMEGNQVCKTFLNADSLILVAVSVAFL